MTKPDDLIGSREACDMLRINRSTLTRWVEAKRLLVAVQLPGKNGAMMFRRVDIEALTNVTQRAFTDLVQRPASVLTPSHLQEGT